MKIFKYCCFLFIALTNQKILAEFYVEPYVGILFGAQKYTCIKATNTFDIEGLCSSFGRCKLKAIKTRPLVGIKCGGWFSKESSLGLWLDGQYHHLDYCQWLCTNVNYCDISSDDPCNCACGVTNTCLNSRGYAITLALPFAYRWRFHEKEYAPFGSCQTYLAIGPGLFLTKQCTSLTVCPHVANDHNFTVDVTNATIINPGQKILKKSPCLVCNCGFSYLFSKHCAVDLFLQYRFTEYKTCFNRCAYLTTRKRCHLGSANLGLVVNF
jgi:hypothetical protein